VGNHGGKITIPGTVLALGLLLAALCGCSSSDFQITPAVPWFDLSGRYASTDEIGALGILTLELEQFEDTVYFSATLTGSAVTEMAEVHGAATLGDYHVIVDFDIGVRSDYYFEGDVTVTEGRVESIDGQFVFPDQEETLPTTFVAY